MNTQSDLIRTRDENHSAPIAGRHRGHVDFHRGTPKRRRLGTVLIAALTSLVSIVAASIVVAVPATAIGRPGATAPSDSRLVWIPRAEYRIAAYVQPGRGPAIVLCHGFPDNHHLYDRVVPLLKGHEIVTFDFLGWGRSSKPSHYSYTFAGQEGDLNAVIQGLHLGRVVLVAHDASVPAVLNWALDHPEQTASIILSNGFYAPVAATGPPALATIFALGQYPNTSPLGPLPPGTAYGLNSLMNGLSTDPRLLDDLLIWQESTFDGNRSIALEFLASVHSAVPRQTQHTRARSLARGQHHLRSRQLRRCPRPKSQIPHHARSHHVGSPGSRSQPQSGRCPAPRDSG